MSYPRIITVVGLLFWLGVGCAMWLRAPVKQAGSYAFVQIGEAEASGSGSSEPPINLPFSQ